MIHLIKGEFGSDGSGMVQRGWVSLDRDTIEEDIITRLGE